MRNVVVTKRVSRTASVDSGRPVFVHLHRGDRVGASHPDDCQEPG
jgi:hypothetical protein